MTGVSLTFDGLGEGGDLKYSTVYYVFKQNWRFFHPFNIILNLFSMVGYCY